MESLSLMVKQLDLEIGKKYNVLGGGERK